MRVKLVIKGLDPKSGAGYVVIHSYTLQMIVRHDPSKSDLHGFAQTGCIEVGQIDEAIAHATAFRNGICDYFESYAVDLVIAVLKHAKAINSEVLWSPAR